MADGGWQTQKLMIKSVRHRKLDAPDKLATRH
jgi:hypothetical protein